MPGEANETDGRVSSRTRPARRCKVAPNLINRIKPPFHIWLPVVERRFVQHENAGPRGLTQLEYQWLYVFREVEGKRTLEYEIYVSAASRWYLAETPDASQDPDQRVANMAPLRRPSTAPGSSVKLYCQANKKHRWLFFLSQAQLHKQGLSELLGSKDNKLLVGIDVTPGIFGPDCAVEVAVLVDAYHLAEDIHRFRYQPLLESYLTMTTGCERWIPTVGKRKAKSGIEDQKIQIRLKRLFIAKGLIQIMGPARAYAGLFPHLDETDKSKIQDEPDDRAGICNNLKIRPGMLKRPPADAKGWEGPFLFLREFNRDADKKLRRAEASLKEKKGEQPSLFDVLNGTAHRIVDDAVLKWPTRGKLLPSIVPLEELSNNADIGVAHWAIITTYLISTPAGQGFLDRIMRSDLRERCWIPADIAYSSRLRGFVYYGPDILPHVTKGNAWAMQLFLNVLPFAYRNLKRNLPPAGAGGGDFYKELPDCFLRGLRLEFTWLLKDLKYTTAAGAKLASQLRDQTKLWHVKLKSEEADLSWVPRQQQQLAKEIRLFGSFADALKLTNAAISLFYVFSQHPVDGNSVMDSMKRLKKLTDLTSAYVSIFELTYAEALTEVGKTTMKSFGQVVGWVGGILSAVLAGKEIERCLKRGDQDAAFFHGVVMSGYVLTSSASLVGAMIYAAGETGSIPVLGWLLVIGLAMVVLGFLLATLLEDNMFEIFAKNCCFGQDADNPKGEVNWAVGVRNLSKWVNKQEYKNQLSILSCQCESMQSLLHQFVVQTVCEYDSRNPQRVGIRIWPGLLSPFSRIEVYLEKKYGHPGAMTTYTCALALTVLEVTGSHPRALVAESSEASRPAQIRDARFRELGPEELHVKLAKEGQVEHIEVTLGWKKPEHTLNGCEAKVQLDCFGEVSKDKLLIPPKPLRHLVKTVSPWCGEDPHSLMEQIGPAATERLVSNERMSWNFSPTESGRASKDKQGTPAG